MKKIVVLLLIMGSLFAVEPKVWSAAFPQKDLAGKAIVYDKQAYLIDVWATWCPPCRMTVPELIALQKEVTKNFMVIGLSVDSDDDKTVLDFVTKEKVNYPVAKANDTLNYFPPVRGIPTMFILNNQGKVVKTFVGYTEKKVLLEAVKKVLGTNAVHK